MPSADKFEAPQGNPLFEVQLRAITESLAGNGILSNGDLEVTAGSGALEIDVAAGTAYYVASESSYGGGAPAATLSGGDANDDRWDTVVFDTSTTSVTVHEGPAGTNPSPPDIQGDELLLALVYVPATATDVADSNILNWRAKFSNEAEEVHYDDSTGTYSVSSVDAALDELQEAAQISAHPLANSDLANSTLDVIAGTGLATTNASIGLGGSATLSIDSGGVGLTQLSNPFALPSISDLDVGGNDLEDSGTTVWDTSEGHVPRPQVDDERSTTGPHTTNVTTNGEEVLLVDTSGGPVTVTLASADIATGNFVTIVDAGGNARTDVITVDTEGGESIDDGTSLTIDTDHGATVVAGDGTQWYTAGGGGGASLAVQDDGGSVEDPVDTLNARSGLAATSTGTGQIGLDYEHREVFEGRESGSVSDTNQGILVIDHLADSETVEVYKAALTLADGQPAPTGLDLELVTLDNSGAFTSLSTLISGDGSTVFDDETGAPLGTHTNSSGSGQTIGVLVDNGTGSAQDVMAAAEGVTGA